VAGPDEGGSADARKSAAAKLEKGGAVARALALVGPGTMKNDTSAMFGDLVVGELFSQNGDGIVIACTRMSASDLTK